MNITNFSRRGFMGMLLAEGRRVKVIAHRGEHLKHRENSLEGTAAAVAMGVDFVELDVRTSRDGRLVLVHDGTVGGRKVREMDWAELKAAGVVEFDAALGLLVGKCGLYLDWKDADAAALEAAVRRRGMVERTIVYGGFEKLRELRVLAPMPEAVSVVHLERCLRELKPRVVAFDLATLAMRRLRLPSGREWGFMWTGWVRRIRGSSG